MARIDPSNAVLVHFYRALVSHADVWRQRMDATTNWAVATTAGMVTFAFGEPSAPHAVVLLSLAFDTVFLLMESRRYQVYDLWRRRFRTLNRYLIAPSLSPGDHPGDEVIEQNLARVAADLARTVPHLGLADAVGHRIRRNYGYLFGLVLLAWLLKLQMHPQAAQHARELVDRAALGALPGLLVIGSVGAFALLCTVIAARASSERMLNWTEVPSPMSRLLARGRQVTPRS